MCFGTQKPRKHNENPWRPTLREYPKNLGSIIKTLGIPIGIKVSLSEFTRILNSLDDIGSLDAYSIYGEYLNGECEPMSVGHMSGDAIFFLMCENNDADSDVGSSSSSSTKSTKSNITKISEKVLNGWYRTNVRTLRYNVIMHMFKNADLEKFAEVTHVELLMVEGLYSIV